MPNRSCHGDPISNIFLFGNLLEKHERKLSVNSLEKSYRPHNPFPSRKRITLKNNPPATLPLH